MALKTLAAAMLTTFIAAGNNGMAVKPPMSWRSWNQFAQYINQDIILSAAQQLADGSRPIVGKPAGTSLRDLGYGEVGMDEGWAACGPKPGWPVGDWAYHRSNADGSVSPVIDTGLFPNMSGLVASIHSLGLRAGWYMNDCLSYCWMFSDTCDDATCTPGDVAAWFNIGFDSLKIDGCSSQHNMTMWATLMNATGRAAIIENCHDTGTPTAPIAQGGCPDYHLYRTSTDIRNTYGSFISNAQTVAPYAASGMTGPTCWAYPDMLMVGVVGDINGASYPPTVTEQRSHFGLWCILSSPLTLSLDLTNATAVELSWPIITNVDAIAVDQAWAGQPGGLYAAANSNVTLLHCTADWDGDKNCTLPVWQAFYKPLPNDAAAALIVNHDYSAAGLTVDFSAIPALTCTGACQFCVYDVWAQASLGLVAGSYSRPVVASHDSLFITITPPSGRSC